MLAGSSFLYRLRSSITKVLAAPGICSLLVFYSLPGHSENTPSFEYGIDATIYRLAIERQDASAQYLVGKRYLSGTTTDKNVQMAVKWFKLAAKQNHKKAQYQLGKMYLYGEKEVSPNFLYAFKYLSKAAENNYLEAQYELGNYYTLGRASKRRYSKAIKWYTQAAKRSHTGALTKLGKLYIEGKGVKPNRKKGKQYLNRAAKLGDWGASNYLKTMARTAKNKAQDEMSADAKQQKNTKTGADVEKSPPVFDQMLIVAREGNANAQYSVALSFLNGGAGIKRNNEKAVKWMQNAAEQDHHDAQYQLGILYHEGIGVQQSDKKAIKWFRPAALAGIEKAHQALNSLLREQPSNVNGVASKHPDLAKHELDRMAKAGPKEKDLPQIKIKIKKIARGARLNSPPSKTSLHSERPPYSTKPLYSRKQRSPNGFRNDPLDKVSRINNPQEQFKAGMVYLLGKSGKKDIDKAIRLLVGAAENNSLNAQLKLADIYYQGIDIEASYAKAAKWYLAAAQQGNADAQYWLATMYKGGLGVIKDKNMAIKWYRKAANQGHAKARNRLGGCRIC